MDNGITDCSPYNCSGTDCLTSCTIDAQCIPGYFCKANECRDWHRELEEDVDPCPGWTIYQSGTSTLPSWSCKDEGYWTNWTGSASGGMYFTADSWLFTGTGETWLYTPARNFTDYVEVWLRFNHSFYTGTGGAWGTLDWTDDGGTNWYNIDSYLFDHTSISENYDVSADVAGRSDVRFRFRFVVPFNFSDEWWQVDDVIIDAI
jgi:hypothetical protein